MVVDYSSFDQSIRGAVTAVESKPHVRYIRYLLTKRHSPINIKKELQRLGLSAPHEPVLIKYYLAVIDPLIKKYKLGALYSDYKNKLMSKNQQHAFSKHLLNYRLNLSEDLELQTNFCKFITELEVDAVWVSEIMKFYGSAANVPLDKDGYRIIKTTSYKRKLDTILMSPKRYLVDKMILENVPDSRIADYCRKEFKIPIYDYDIIQYKEVFFNLKTYDIEGKLHSLEVEKNSLNSFMEIIDGDSDMELGEKLTIKLQTEKRIQELDDNIKTLNMFYSEYAFKSAQIDKNNFVEMFQDVVQRSYQRFTALDNFKDRDVVEPLFKVAKIMGYAYEKVTDIVENTSNTGDKHSQYELMKLYRQRVDDLYAQQTTDQEEKAKFDNNNIMQDNVNVDNIEGTDELGIMIDSDEDPDLPDNK